MFPRSRVRVIVAMMVGMVVLALAMPAHAQRGRGGGGFRGGGGGFRGGGGFGGGGFGGARPSMGRMGGGYGGMSPGMARPSMPRPSMPGGGNFNRPSYGNRPSSLGPTTRPNFPGGGGLGNYPGGGGRPSLGNLPGSPGAGLGNINRPGTGGGNVIRPGGGDRPGLGNLPGSGGSGLGNISRPGTLPSTPGAGLGNINRPGGGADRPGLGNLPGGMGDRPGGGLFPGLGGGTNRPGIDNRPGGGNNIIGGGGNINNRPIIGGGGNTIINNRPIIGGGNVVNNRPGWGNWNNRPGWGLGPGYRNPWINGYIHGYHRGWYNGAWAGSWANMWYAPFAFGTTAWGLGALGSAWGYGYGIPYANPYYVPVAADPGYYDYSQPIVMQSYGDAESSTGDASQEGPDPNQTTDAQQAGYALFDQARAAFKSGDYATALSQTEQAIQSVPNDPVLHEFGALCLFALGDYQRAAAVLNALLAVAPGMNWATMSQLYPSVDVYTQQLRTLEAHVKQNPRDPAGQFVLAYHYLVTGATDAAIRALKAVVDVQPKDQVAARILNALKSAKSNGEASSATDSGAGTTPTPTTPADTQAPSGPTTDLVGSWDAGSDGGTFTLALTEDSRFTWKAAPKGQQPVTVTGHYQVDGDMLILESDQKDQGTMAARVTSGGADQFSFALVGGPPGDPGLTFHRDSSSQ